MAAPTFESARTAIFSAIEAAITADGDGAESTRMDAQALVYEAVKGQPLPDAKATRGDQDLDGGTEAPLLTEGERSTIELAVRMYLDRCICGEEHRSAKTFEAARVPELLDFAISLTNANIADYNLPFALLEDLFDSQVISQSQALFSLVEDRAAALSSLIHTTVTGNNTRMRAKLTFIRTCIALLRRLSKSKNTNFCGRVLLLVAYTLPLSERSGVNLKGVTAPSQVEVATSPEDSGADAIAADAGGKTGLPDLDFSFYSSFWSLQKAFCDPAAATAPAAWDKLQQALQAVLQVFGAFVEDEAPAVEGEAAGAERAEQAAAEVLLTASAAMEATAMEVDCGADAAGSSAQQEVYFTKFLTSPKLMGLQLRDPYFRRHMLVQILIFLQTATTERKGAVALGEQQRAQVDELQQRCDELLRGVGPNGTAFAATVKGMLQRERHWIEWKRLGCSAFDKAAAQAKVVKKRPAAASSRAGKRMSLGHSELSRLWNLGSNSLEAIADSSSKQRVPSLAKYLQPVVEQMDPAAGIEDEYKLKNDKVFTWKALRLMAKKDVSLLAKVSAPQGSIEAAVKHMLDKGRDSSATPAEETAVTTQPDAA